MITILKILGFLKKHWKMIVLCVAGFFIGLWSRPAVEEFTYSKTTDSQTNTVSNTSSQTTKQKMKQKVKKKNKVTKTIIDKDGNKVVYSVDRGTETTNITSKKKKNKKNTTKTDTKTKTVESIQSKKTKPNDNNSIRVYIKNINPKLYNKKEGYELGAGYKIPLIPVDTWLDVGYNPGKKTVSSSLSIEIKW